MHKPAVFVLLALACASIATAASLCPTGTSAVLQQVSSTCAPPPGQEAGPNFNQYCSAAFIVTTADTSLTFTPVPILAPKSNVKATKGAKSPAPPSCQSVTITGTISATKPSEAAVKLRKGDKDVSTLKAAPKNTVHLLTSRRDRRTNATQTCTTVFQVTKGCLLGATARARACPPGTATAKGYKATAYCQACPPGTYSSTRGAAKCSKCPAGSAPTPTQDACAMCIQGRRCCAVGASKACPACAKGAKPKAVSFAVAPVNSSTSSTCKPTSAKNTTSPRPDAPRFDAFTATVLGDCSIALLVTARARPDTAPFNATMPGPSGNISAVLRQQGPGHDGGPQKLQKPQGSLNATAGGKGTKGGKQQQPGGTRGGPGMGAGPSDKGMGPMVVVNAGKFDVLTNVVAQVFQGRGSGAAKVVKDGSKGATRYFRVTPADATCSLRFSIKAVPTVNVVTAPTNFLDGRAGSEGPHGGKGGRGGAGGPAGGDGSTAAGMTGPQGQGGPGGMTGAPGNGTAGSKGGMEGADGYPAPGNGTAGGMAGPQGGPGGRGGQGGMRGMLRRLA